MSVTPISSGRGRKPKPVSKKQLAGNPGKRKLNGNEPTFTQLVEIDPPVWLDEIAKGMWMMLVPQLCGQKVLCVTDIHNLEIFCSAYSNWRSAQAEVSSEGPTLKDEAGKSYKNPAMTALNESARQISTFGSLLGLDPSSRQRLIGGNKQNLNNPFLAL